LILTDRFRLLLCFTEDRLPPGFPVITRDPQLKVVEKGRMATLLCSASGNPDPEITWFKDMSPVDMTDPRIRLIDSGKHDNEKNKFCKRSFCSRLFYFFASGPPIFFVNKIFFWPNFEELLNTVKTKINTNLTGYKYTFHNQFSLAEA